MCYVLVPYAWDEPTSLPHISLKVQNGTCATYDMNTVGDGEKLYYENFIYIAFTHTFRRCLCKIINSKTKQLEAVAVCMQLYI